MKDLPTPICPKCGQPLEFVEDYGDGYEFICRSCERQEFYAHGAFGEDDDEDGGLPPDEAADIWRSNGMDEDYMFGYDVDTLRNS